MPPFSTSDGIAVAAFLLSAYATWKTYQFNERQKGLIESQERLNKLLLEKEASEASSTKRADLGANFIKLGSNKYRLKIFNKGKSTARNVSIDFPEGNDCIIQSDIEAKFPLERMEPHQSVELIAAVHMQTKSKHVIKLNWSDEHAEDNEKLVYPTI
ncbi:hypothetical protein A6R71_07870 [Xanthomonas translucens pv. arrhenatheri]|uniref:Uncharacterized protein n=1 Tax=Xanthomonas graminis pv. arrhenatheri LMG 727 TaxID=1195923 RepID=A0A0K3A537_9XANT|nr:hypothetical protein [Xanthomonas translucens]OAX65459.1 hypothetical protein A6R71_07870 [Xanthomonas translucens pv. arrhenatheri]UKE78478.1 hypothetical protein KM317_04385 [Xanthomonas translucens pv. arrhenatheri]CTP91544.1 hypothetical protein XTALMG727_3469 [Xanthomonas translucens pv. arrhenatheri LMG 727]